MAATESERIFITDDEIDAINAARDALEAIAGRGGRDYEAAIAYIAATEAEHSLFMVLNYCNSHLHRDMTYRQLHNVDPS